MKNRLLCIATLVSVTACGDSGTGSSVSSGNVNVLPAFPPVDSASLTATLETRYSSEESYDYWHCVVGGGISESYILLPRLGTFVDAAGLQQGLETSAPGATEWLRTLWEATSANSFMMEYPDFGVALDFTDLVFSNENSMSFNNVSTGVINCNRGSFENVPVPPPAAPAADSNVLANNGVEGLVGMYGFFVTRPLAGGIIGFAPDAVFAFEDGTFTYDMDGVLNSSIEASRVNNPEDWGTWRGPLSALALKDWDETEFDEVSRPFLAQPGLPNQTLNRCYESILPVGVQLPNGVGIVTSSTYCFFDNGRFTEDFAAFNQGENSTVASTSPQTNGQYRITGHVLELFYDSGTSGKLAFAFTDLDRNSESILLNGASYSDF